MLPVALLGLLFAGLVIAERVGLPQEVDPVGPFVVGYHTGIDEALEARGASVPSEPSRYGYDGQWFLGQAHDPLLRSDLPDTFDSPRYRSLRVLLPATGWLLAAGQSTLIPFALLAIEVLAVALGCAACARIVAGYGRSRWWGLMFAAIPGVLLGVAFGTAEPLGLALVALGLTLALDRRYTWAGLAFAGAALTKENYLVFGLVTAAFLTVDSYLRGTPVRVRDRFRPAAACAVPGAVALAGWWLYVARALPPDNNPNSTLDVFTVPFLGWWEILWAIVQGDYLPGYGPVWLGRAVLAGTFGLLVVAVVQAARIRRSLLAYQALAWGGYGLTIVGFLLERYVSAQRTLAPALLVAGLLLLTGRFTRASPAAAGVSPVGAANGQPPDPPPRP